MKALAVALVATAAIGSGGTPTSTIVFAADRAPSLSGDVFRVDANGHVANLTHSAWQETQPVVSPNGKLVAFVSDRFGGSLWTIGVAGTRLHRLDAKGFPSQYAVDLAWSPDSRTLAYTTGGSSKPLQTLWLVGLAGPARAIGRAQALGWPAWSPDGRLVAAVTAGGTVEAFTRAGKRAWTVSSSGRPVGWSATGLFATGAYGGRIHVVDENGRQRFSVPARNASWSADGTTLVTPPKASLGPNTVGSGTNWDVRDGTHVYTHVTGCDDDGGPVAAVASLQRVPHSTSLVYQSYCAEPFDNLYSIRADGTGFRRITNVQANQVQPTLSPDGTRIAFGESQYTGLSCKGCAESLRTIGVDGTSAATLTSPPDCTFDGSPSWSPDGTQIVFVHSGCDSAPVAMVVAAGGGATKNLHVPAWTVVWGPARIAYANGTTDPSSMWTAVPDGTGRVEVGSIGAGLTTPAWSADGRLAYLVGTSVVVDGKKTALPFAQVRSVAWSPDGTRLLVAAKPNGAPTFDLYTVKTDGTEPVRLTTNMDVSSGDWR